MEGVRSLLTILIVGSLLLTIWGFPQENEIKNEKIQVDDNEDHKPTQDELPQSIKTERNPNAHVAFEIKNKFGNKLTLGPDMVFTEEGDIDVNQGRLTVARELDITPLRTARAIIDHRILGHREECHKMHNLYNLFHKEKYVIARTDSGQYYRLWRDQAQELCRSKNMELPEVRTREEGMALGKLIHSIRAKDGGLFTKTHAGVSRPAEGLKTYTYMSETAKQVPKQRDEIKKATPLCSKLQHDWYYDTPQSTYIYEYHPETQSLSLCAEDPDEGAQYKTRLVICMKKDEDNDALRIDKDYEFCLNRNHEMKRTSEEAGNTIQYMSETLSVNKIREARRRSVINPRPEQPQPQHTEISNETLDRVKRLIWVVPTAAAIGIGAATAISQLVSLALAGAGLKGALQNAQKVHALELDMHQIAQDFNKTLMQINHNTYVRSRRHQLQRNEQAYFDRVTLDFSNLRDNLLSHEGLLNSVINREANIQLINNTDIQMLEDELRKDRDVYLSRKHESFDTYPIIQDEKLYIAISIPILTPDKEAKLYSISKIPTFVNGNKYISNCKETHLVVYQDSSEWNTISTREALQCLDPKNRCEINMARNSARIQNCASAQFFLKKHNVVLKQEEDDIPFVQAINDTIFLSLPHKEVTLEFHCKHMDAPGADRVIKTQGKSMVHNPFLCDYSIPEYGLSFSPIRDPSTYQMPKFEGRFSITHTAMVLPEGADEPIYQIDYMRPLRTIIHPPQSSTQRFISFLWTPFRALMMALMAVVLAAILILGICLGLIYYRVPLPWKMHYNLSPPANQVIPTQMRRLSDTDTDTEPDDDEDDDEDDEGNMAGTEDNTETDQAETPTQRPTGSRIKLVRKALKRKATDDEMDKDEQQQQIP